MIAAGVSVLRADSGSCTYGLPSVTTDLAAAGGTVSIGLTAQGNCTWSATSDSSEIIQITPNSGSTSGTAQVIVHVTVNPNPDQSPRLLNVTLGDPAAGTQLFMICGRLPSATISSA